MKNPHKIGAYIRVSTDKQAQVFEGSLDTQKYRMQEFVKLKNQDHGNWGEVIEFYIDEQSAKDTRRPAYQKMMQDIRSGKINLILMADISRLSRSTYDFGALLKELEKYDASYLSMKEQFDTTTPAGRMMINMVVNMAQFEREQVSERVSINCNSRAMRGFVNGGKVPYGYDKDELRKGSYVINIKESENVRVIFETLRDVGGIGKLIPIIESLGIRPKYSLSGKWTHDQLKALLTSVVYIGKREVNKENRDKDQDSLKPWQRYDIVKASWPPIVDLELFKEVQDIIATNVSLERRRLSNADKRIFLLTGILFCDCCGRSLNGQSAHGKINVHRYYAHGYKRNSTHVCNLKRQNADHLEQAVVNHISTALSDAGYFSKIEGKIKKDILKSPDQIQDEISKLRVAVKELEKKISVTIDRQLEVSSGSIEAEEYGERIQKLGKEKRYLLNHIELLKEQLYSSVEPDVVCNEIKNNISDFQRGFKKAPLATKRRLIHKIFRKLELTAQGIKVYLSMPTLETTSSNLKSQNSNGRINGFEAVISLKSKIKGFENSLSDAFENLLIGEIGWGGRT